MSLNNIDLPAAVIAELYKNNLLEIPEKGDKENKLINQRNTGVIPVPHLGKNQKRITILVHYPSDVYIPEDQLTFLSNILNACGLHIGDIAIVNAGIRNLDFATIVKELQTEKLIVFRNIPLLDIPGDPFKIIKLGDVTVLNVPTLEKMNGNSEDSKLLKSKLWVCLKQLFNI